MNTRAVGILRKAGSRYRDALEMRKYIENHLRAQELADDVTGQLLDSAKRLEDLRRKELVGRYRELVPDSIREWQKEAFGIGELSLAQLLGIVGHPRVAIPMHYEGDELVQDDPFIRTEADLWAYCGVGDMSRWEKIEDPTEQQMRARGNRQAKAALWNLVEAVMRVTLTHQKGRYLETYEKARAKYDERGWKPGHAERAARLLVGKKILRHLYRVAPAA